MIKKLRNIILVLGVAFGIGLMMPAGANAASVIADQCQSDPSATICQQKGTVGDLVKTIINVLLFIIGAVSVIMIIVGGFLYTTSAGDSAAVTRAKNTITYAIVGLVVAFVAYAVVNYVTKLFIK